MMALGMFLLYFRGFISEYDYHRNGLYLSLENSGAFASIESRHPKKIGGIVDNWISYSKNI